MKPKVYSRSMTVNSTSISHFVVDEKRVAISLRSRI